MEVFEIIGSSRSPRLHSGGERITHPLIEFSQNMVLGLEQKGTRRMYQATNFVW